MRILIANQTLIANQILFFFPPPAKLKTKNLNLGTVEFTPYLPSFPYNIFFFYILTEEELFISSFVMQELSTTIPRVFIPFPSLPFPPLPFPTLGGGGEAVVQERLRRPWCRCPLPNLSWNKKICLYYPLSFIMIYLSMLK